MDPHFRARELSPTHADPDTRDGRHAPRTASQSPRDPSALDTKMLYLAVCLFVLALASLLLTIGTQYVMFARFGIALDTKMLYMPVFVLVVLALALTDKLLLPKSPTRKPALEKTPEELMESAFDFSNFDCQADREARILAIWAKAKAQLRGYGVWTGEMPASINRAQQKGYITHGQAANYRMMHQVVLKTHFA
jgi:hypothetical protein